MFSMRIGKNIYTNVIGFSMTSREGFSEIKGNNCYTRYTGFYGNEYFDAERVSDHGEHWAINYYNGNASDDELIEWITNPNNHSDDKVYQNWAAVNKN